MAIRVVTAYRTVSFDAATLLAKTMPPHILARLYGRTYERSKDLKERENWSLREVNEVRSSEEFLARRQWNLYLGRQQAYGRRTRDAILPDMDSWLDCDWCHLDFYSTQLMIGHGVFASYLHRIGKADSPICGYCRMEEDTAEHTLTKCQEWAVERGELENALGIEDTQTEEITLRKIVGKGVESKKAWAAFRAFASAVMRKKEHDEREGERELIGSQQWDGES